MKIRAQRLHQYAAHRPSSVPEAWQRGEVRTANRAASLSWRVASLRPAFLDEFRTGDADGVASTTLNTHFPKMATCLQRADK